MIGFVLLSFITVTAGQAILECSPEYSSPESCIIIGGNLDREQIDYKIISQSPQTVKTVLVKTRLGAIGPAFCETFPALEDFEASSVEIEVVDPDAFRSCRNLKHFNVSNNAIQNLSEDLFYNALKLQTVDVRHNRIGSIPDEFFETNTLLEVLYFDDNFVSHFPAKALKFNKNLRELGISVNEIYQLQVAELLSYLPALKIVYISGNIFPCSEVKKIIPLFINRNVVLATFQYSRERPFRLGAVAQCIDDAR